MLFLKKHKIKSFLRFLLGMVLFFYSDVFCADIQTEKEQIKNLRRQINPEEKDQADDPHVYPPLRVGSPQDAELLSDLLVKLNNTLLPITNGDLAVQKPLAIIIGGRGSGKSTLAHFLAGCTMNIPAERNRIEPTPRLPGFFLGRDSTEGTPFPVCFPVPLQTAEYQEFLRNNRSLKTDIQYWDLPGFSDPKRLHMDMIAFFSMQLLIRRAHKCSIVLCVDYNSFNVGRGTQVVKQLLDIHNIFQDHLEYLRERLVIVVTKIPSNKTATTIFDSLFGDGGQEKANSHSMELNEFRNAYLLMTGIRDTRHLFSFPELPSAGSHYQLGHFGDYNTILQFFRNTPVVATALRNLQLKRHLQEEYSREFERLERVFRPEVLNAADPLARFFDVLRKIHLDRGFLEAIRNFLTALKQVPDERIATPLSITVELFNLLPMFNPPALSLLPKDRIEINKCLQEILEAQSFLHLKQLTGEHIDLGVIPNECVAMLKSETLETLEDVGRVFKNLSSWSQRKIKTLNDVQPAKRKAKLTSQDRAPVEDNKLAKGSERKQEGGTPTPSPCIIL